MTFIIPLIIIPFSFEGMTHLSRFSTSKWSLILVNTEVSSELVSRNMDVLGEPESVVCRERACSLNKKMNRIK